MGLNMKAERRETYAKAFVVRLGVYAVLAGLTFAATFAPREPRIVLGSLIALVSFLLVNIARIQLGKSFSVMPTAKALVTRGVYARIAHPLYLFVNVTLLGVIILFGAPIVLVGWCVFVLVQSLQARREEQVLASAFGAEYHTYRAQTWF